MATGLHADEFDNAFDDHPSLSASLEDFEENPSPRSAGFRFPSQHSGFRSGHSTDPDETLDNGSSTGDPWSPPGFKRMYMDQNNHNPQLFSSSMAGSAWYRHQPYPRHAPALKPTPGSSAMGSREPSPQYEDALEKPPDTDYPADLLLPASIPLPPGTDSPLKGRSPSPEPEKEHRKTKQREQRSDGESINGGDNGDSSTLTNCRHRPCFSAL